MTQPKTLERLTLRTSRLMDFCSEKELVAQTGHTKIEWPLVILKELMDNALDACEEARTAPEIAVSVSPDCVSVSDNGPGIPESTVKDILDFSVRVSSREAYMAPDRGRQGNALKTIVAMPYVLDGHEGHLSISARGVEWCITFEVDPIRQTPRCTLTPKPSSVTTGTSVRVQWPDSACSILEGQKTRFLQIAEDYTWLNPHLTLSLQWYGDGRVVNASNPSWDKWTPSNPTSGHWYNLADFKRLIAGYIAYDEDHAQVRLVRDFIGEFRGLAGSAKRKAILEETGLGRANLSSLVNGNALDHEVAGRLLAAMQSCTAPVKPQLLGIIGEEHLRARFQAAGCEMESFEYKRILLTEPLPEAYEFAFGCFADEAKERRLITGVNWSPGILNPFRQLGQFQSLDNILSEAKVNRNEPVILFLHVASPVVRYTDRGKSAVETR